MNNIGQVFNLLSSDPAFSAATLTELVNNTPFVPSRLGEMGLFQTRGVATDVVAVEVKNNEIHLVPSSARGSANKQNTLAKKDLKFFSVPHIAEEANITPDEFRNVRMEGTTQALESVTKIIREHSETITTNIDLTEENLRLGAIKGVVLDADGTTVLADLYAIMGVTAPSIVAFDFTDATLDIRSLAAGVRRTIIKNAKGSFTPNGKIRCFMGDAAWDAFVNHPTVLKAYTNYQDMTALQKDFTFGEFVYAGIIWENYRGDEGGQGVSIGNTEMRFFPEEPRLFRTYYAPADTVDYVGTDGLPRYMWQEVALNRKHVRVEVQSNPLPLCLKPGVLVQGTATV